MSTSAASHCPDCKAELGPQSRICAQCGADVGLWPESQRTPLILPGNPALSADVVRKRTSIPKIVAGTTVLAAAIGAVLYYMPERDSEELPPVGVTASAPDSVTLPSPPVPPVVATVAAAPVVPPPEPTVPDSLAAYSYGDTALSRAVPDVAPSRPATSAPAARVVDPTPPAPAPAPKPVSPPATRAVRTPPTVATRTATRTPARNVSATTPKAAKPVTRPVTAPAGTLSVTPLVSTTLKPGERLQLRWAVVDRSTKRPIPRSRAEFTSTDENVADVGATTGLVVARAPGTVRIIIDAGTAGRNTVTLTVRAATPTPAAPVATAAASSEAPRAPAATPPAPVAPTPVPAAPRETPRADMPDATEIRTVVDRFIRDVRRDGVRNAGVSQFLADGADHRVILVAGPNIVSTTAQGVRIAFDLRFTKFDGGGRPVTRVSSVSMDVDKRDGTTTSSAIAIGSLRRP